MLTSKPITKIIQSCLDDQRTLRDEGQRVDEPRRAVLTRLADERGDFAADLERLNGQSSRESWGSLLRGLGRNVWAGATGRNETDAIAACRRSQSRTEARYEAVLEQKDLPGALKATLSIQHARLVAAGDELAKIEY